MPDSGASSLSSRSYGKASPEDQAFIHLFLEAFYIAGRLDYYRDVPTNAACIGDSKLNDRSLACKHAVAARFGLNDQAMTNWWTAANMLMRNRDLAAGLIPETRRDAAIPKDTGPIGMETFGPRLSLVTPSRIAASWHKGLKGWNRNMLQPTAGEMHEFIAAQFARTSPPVPLTPDQKDLILSFAERHPDLFEHRKKSYLPAHLSDVEPPPKAPFIERLAGESVGTRRALHANHVYTNDPEAKPGPMR